MDEESSVEELPLESALPEESETDEESFDWPPDTDELSERTPDTDELLMLSELSEDELSPQATAASVNAQEQESKNAIKVFFIITP